MISRQSIPVHIQKPGFGFRPLKQYIFSVGHFISKIAHVYFIKWSGLVHRRIFRWTGKDQGFKSQACLKIHWQHLSITIGRDEKRTKMDVDSISSVDGCSISM